MIDTVIILPSSFIKNKEIPNDAKVFGAQLSTICDENGIIEYDAMEFLRIFNLTPHVSIFYLRLLQVYNFLKLVTETDDDGNIITKEIHLFYF